MSETTQLATLEQAPEVVVLEQFPEEVSTSKIQQLQENYYNAKANGTIDLAILALASIIRTINESPELRNIVVERVGKTTDLRQLEELENETESSIQNEPGRQASAAAENDSTGETETAMEGSPGFQSPGMEVSGDEEEGRREGKEGSGKPDISDDAIRGNIDVGSMIPDSWIEQAKSDGVPSRIVTEVVDSGKQFANYHEFLQECQAISNIHEEDRQNIKNIKANHLNGAIDRVGSLQGYVKQKLATHYGTTCLHPATLEWELNRKLPADIMNNYPNGILYWAVEHIPEEKMPECQDGFVYNLDLSNPIDEIMARTYNKWENDPTVLKILDQLIRRAGKMGLHEAHSFEEAVDFFAASYMETVSARRLNYNAPLNYCAWLGLSPVIELTDKEQAEMNGIFKKNVEVRNAYAQNMERDMNNTIPFEAANYNASQGAFEEANRLGFMANMGSCAGRVMQAPFAAADSFSNAMAEASPWYAQKREEQRNLKDVRRANKQAEKLNAEQLRHQRALNNQAAQQARQAQQAQQQPYYDARYQQAPPPPQRQGPFGGVFNRQAPPPPPNNYGYNQQPVYGQEQYGPEKPPIASNKLIIVAIQLVVALIVFFVDKKKGVFMFIGAIVASIGWLTNGNIKQGPPQYGPQGQVYQEEETGAINPAAFIVVGYIIMAIALFL